MAKGFGLALLSATETEILEFPAPTFMIKTERYIKRSQERGEVSKRLKLSILITSPTSQTMDWSKCARKALHFSKPHNIKGHGPSFFALRNDEIRLFTGFLLETTQTGDRYSQEQC